MPVSARYNRVEEDADLDAASRIFMLSVTRFQQLGDLPGPLPGSMLATEDGHTARVPISTQVQMASARARDALEAFRDLTVEEANDSAMLRPFAHYALVRMACEGAGLGLWLMRPAVKARRVHRSLNLEFTHDQDARDFSATLTRQPRNQATPELDRFLARLNELKNSVSQLRELELKRIPAWSDILVDISPPLGRSTAGHAPDSPFVIWKVASAFLHGSSVTMRALSDLEQLTDFGENRMATMEMRPSWRLLAASFGTCVQMLYNLYERYEFLGTHDYAQRPVQDLVDANPTSVGDELGVSVA